MMAVGDSAVGHEAVTVHGNNVRLEWRSRWLPAAIITLLGLLLASPAVILGYPVARHNDDGLIHLVWQAHVSRQFWNGDLYPRWLMDMNGGRGSPSHFFYAPVPHLLASLPAPLLGDDGLGRRQLSLAAVVALIASGLTCYGWLRNRFRAGPAILGAFVYMVMPYHLADDLYARSSFNEFWSFVWLPIILMFVEGSRRWPARVAGISIAYALLVLTHPLIAFIYSPVVVAYAGYLSLRKRERQAFVQALLGLGIGTLLAALYLLPAMTGQDSVRMYEFMVVHGDWHVETGLLFSAMPWKLSLLVLNCAAVATCAFFFAHRSGAEDRAWVWFWAAIFGAAFLMMTPLSVPIWHVITPLKWLQFPWRFLVVGTLACAAIVTAAAAAYPGLNRTMRLGSIVSAVIVGLTWIPSYWYSIGKAYGEGQQQPLVEAVRSAGDVAEYIPRWVHASEFSVVGRGRVSFSTAADKFRVVSGEAKIELKRWEPRHIEISVSAADSATVEVGQFYYPNWTARIDGGVRLLPLAPSAPAGLLTVSLPPGEYVVDLALEMGWAEVLGLAVSAFAAILVALMLLSLLRKPATFAKRPTSFEEQPREAHHSKLTIAAEEAAGGEKSEERVRRDG